MSLRPYYLITFLFFSVHAPSSASIISINGYSLDTDKGVISSSDNLEWLQWSKTINLSPNQALSGIAQSYDGGGWKLANNEQVAGLLNTFNFGLEIDTDYRTFQDKKGPYVRGDNLSEDPFTQFTTLFGNTYTLSANTTGVDPLSYSYAQFGENTSTVQAPNRVLVQGDFFSTTFNRPYASEIYVSHLTGNMNVHTRTLGVALVREKAQNSNIVNVSEPSILLMFFFSLLCCARKVVKKKPSFNLPK
ncbi:hypothetical protein GTQ48_06470 [Alteromonas genovensis]|uniref:PEP-CTERM sorting domain-containing protein n=1 Tax=Alteromonas genovensis TaxID=471225 RepID=A0A6N9TDC9_9ALTE|nr:hypothetical protein [Alteromonas genovensis]NDW15161.1 hypothetical protein [Alteromonas genovensis]